MTLEQLRIERTVAAFNELSIKVKDETALQLQRNYELEQTRLTLRDGAAALFEQLRDGGMDIGLITNGPTKHQMNKIKALELLNWVDEKAVYISDGIGMAKPDPDVFHHVQQRAAFLPEQMVYVGDAWHNDIAPSSQAGWFPIWLNPRRQHPNAADSNVKYMECRALNEVMPLVMALNNRDTGCLL
ncbi:HAD family hydrolase [Paenibacillus sp. FJAT-27812]|uniref:HAD family hydrolase n=1 Tax=Paenibacillus sp. FJAT-27812 TaxID=1684143 RepID=UPI0006A7AF09|nr:HAD-IA family hydrolase [Paenibacillus sp. FJAT-27812]